MTFQAAAAETDGGPGVPEQPATFTVVVERHPAADKEWSASVHRKDGSLIKAFAGDSAYDVLGEAAKIVDKEAAR